VVFSPLTEDEVKQIAELYLSMVTRQMKRQDKILEVSEGALNYLVEKGFSPQYGARFLKRTIDELVKLPVTTRWKEADHFDVDFIEGEMKIKTTDS
jgi:ATP-dependent Clp protease ATP-binding subunit ClpC